MVDINNIGDHVDGALVVESQSQKATTSNSLDNLLSDATQLPLDITITANKTLTDDEFFGHLIFELSGTPAADFSLFLPTTGEHWFIVRNNTGKICTVDAGVSGGTVVALSTSLSGLFHSDGTSVISTSDPDVLKYSVAGVDAAADYFLFWNADSDVLSRVLGEDLPGGAGGAGSGGIVQEELTESPITSDNTVSEYIFDVSDYAQVEITMDAIGFASANTASLRYSTDGGSTYKSGATDYRDMALNPSSGSDADATSVPFHSGSTTTSGINGTMVVSNLRAGRATHYGVASSSGSALRYRAGFAKFGGPITHIKIFSTGDNFNAGTIRAVGLKQDTQVATVQTTDATQTVITSAAMAADSAHTIHAIGHGREDATGDTYHFELFGGARNEGGTSTVPTPNVVEVTDAGASTWDATLVANDTSDEWEIKVTGEGSHTIDWTVAYSKVVTTV